MTPAGDEEKPEEEEEEEQEEQEKPKDEEEEQEEQEQPVNGAGNGDTAAAASDEVGTDDPQTSSSLEEDLLSAPNAQSSLAANDPVRLATAAYLTKCTEEGTTPVAWVLQMVLPPGGAHAGPPQAQVAHVRETNSLNASPSQTSQNLDCVSVRAQTSSARNFSAQPTCQ